MSHRSISVQSQIKVRGLQPQTQRVKLGLSLLAASAMVVALSCMPVHASSLSKQFRPKGSGQVDHSAFDALLSRYVVKMADGSTRVKYRALRGARPQLQAYLANMQKVSVQSLSSNAAKAYLDQSV